MTPDVRVLSDLRREVHPLQVVTVVAGVFAFGVAVVAVALAIGGVL